MELKDKIREIISNHNLLHLATVKADGTPALRGVDYANGEDESVLYFVTRADSNKISQIKQNSNVSVVVDHDCPSMPELLSLKYFKATAVASTIDNPEEAQQAMGLLMKKFPFLAELPGKQEDFVPVKLELKEVQVTDNTVGFGHTEIVNY